MRICLSQVWRIQLPNVSIIYLLWSQAKSSFSTRGWIRPRHRAMASITGLSGSINHRITGACGVRSSSLLLSPYQPHPGVFVWLLFYPNPLLWYSNGKSWKCPEGQRDLDMLRSLFKRESCPLKNIHNRKQPSVIDTPKQLLPAYIKGTHKRSCSLLFEPSLVSFSCCLCLTFSQCPPLWSPPPFLMQPHPHCSDFYPLTHLTSGWLCDKQEHDRKPHNLTSCLRTVKRKRNPL